MSTIVYIVYISVIFVLFVMPQFAINALQCYTTETFEIQHSAEFTCKVTVFVIDLNLQYKWTISSYNNQEIHLILNTFTDSLSLASFLTITRQKRVRCSQTQMYVHTHALQMPPTPLVLDDCTNSGVWSSLLFSVSLGINQHQFGGRNF